MNDIQIETRKHSPTFYQDGKRRVKCPNPTCGKVLGRKDRGVIYSRLSDNKIKFYECYHCREKFWVKPPVKGLNEQGMKIIRWGGNQSEWTPDLTDKDVEDTIPAEE